MKRNHLLQFIIVFSIICAWTIMSGIQGAPPNWGRTPACQEAIDQLNSESCASEAYGNVDILKSCLDACGGVGACEDNCWTNWDASIPSCLTAADNIIYGVCGDCGMQCFEAFNQYQTGCIYDTGRTGAECLDILIACVNGC